MGGNLRLVTNSSWKESTLAYAKSPAVSTVLSFAAAVRDGDIVEFDLGAAITGNGTYSFALTSSSLDKISYGSSESASPPKLIVDQS